MGGKRKTEASYYELAARFGFAWLGQTLPKSTGTPTIWQCSKGHKWQATYSDLKRAIIGCRKCYDDRNRKKPNDYNDLAVQQKCIWLGPEVQLITELTAWKCKKCGYEWQNTYCQIQKGIGCPNCKGRPRKTPRKAITRTPEHYHELAKQKGYIWLGPTVSNVNTKTWWQCSQGHKWETNYHTLSKIEQGCPQCGRIETAKKTRRKPNDYRKLATSKGFVWLGPVAPNIRTKTIWQCDKGHKWRATYDRIAHGGECYRCNTSRGEAEVARVLVALGYEFHAHKTFPDCKNQDGNLLSFDFLVFIDSVKMGLIEFDGEHHFRPVNHWGGEDLFKAIKRHDKIKNQFAREHKISLLRIPYNDLDSIEQIIVNWIDSTKSVSVNDLPKGKVSLYKDRVNWKIATQLTLPDI